MQLSAEESIDSYIYNNHNEEFQYTCYDYFFFFLVSAMTTYLNLKRKIANINCIAQETILKKMYVYTNIYTHVEKDE